MRHIIFDMDGVLIDSEPEYQKRTRKYIRSLGLELPEEMYDLICGSNLRDSYQLLRNRVSGFEVTYQEYVEGKLELLRKEPLDVKGIADKELYPLLQYLKEQKYHIALASSSPKDRIVSYLEELGVLDFFEVIVSGMDFKRSKPDPEIYFYTLSCLHVSAEQCLVVEDSTYGIEAAKAAGTVVIGKKDQRFGYDQSRADYLVEHLGQVKEICEQLEKK
ncbi:MAG TPA: HAD family phosphatase [Candidatus Mediterraneibacter norfolkensis]|nr:HAD family phosphatase [Candidatus Mediterraneibacter norfolkensis]